MFEFHFKTNKILSFNPTPKTRHTLGHIGIPGLFLVFCLVND